MTSRASWLADVLRGAGLTVIETPGWRGRGRDFPAAPQGLVMHHTASPVSSSLATNLAVVTNGNSVAPGPIAQALFWRPGTVYLIADGRANHAGKGGPWGGWCPQDQANLRTLGFECVNNGVGELWAADLVASMEIAAAATMRYLDLPVDRVLMHSEWAPGRKIDPAGPNGGRIAYAPGTRTMTWSGDAFRARVRGWKAPPPLPPIEVTPDPTPVPVEAVRMFIIVGNKANPADPRRWVWDGAVSMRLLGSELEYRTMLDRANTGLVKLHPAFSTLASPFWMDPAEMALYGAAA